MMAGMMDRDVPQELSRRYESTSEDSETSNARIMSQLESMQDGLAKTHSLLNELEENLSPILIPSYPTEGENVATPPRKLSSMVSANLDDRNYSINDLQRRLVQLRERIQL